MFNELIELERNRAFFAKNLDPNEEDDPDWEDYHPIRTPVESEDYNLDTTSVDDPEPPRKYRLPQKMVQPISLHRWH